MKPTGFILYEGPSLLDGAPIVAIAITSRSRNRKTGAMLQTYIMRSDAHPIDAVKSGADASVCGDCKHRPSLGGACYVDVGRGAASVYGAFKRGRYPRAADTDTGPALAILGTGRMVRLGTYGDPAAVPARVWQALVSRASGHTGYTHQWLNGALPQAHRDAINSLCMASVDTPSEADMARSIGLRTFRVRRPDEPLAAREFTCPASEEAGKKRTCAECGACNGSAKATAASVAIIAHGILAVRFLQVTQ